MRSLFFFWSEIAQSPINRSNTSEYRKTLSGHVAVPFVISFDRAAFYEGHKAHARGQIIARSYLRSEQRGLFYCSALTYKQAILAPLKSWNYKIQSNYHPL